LDYWDGRCPLTGITDPVLLRASHIVPWSDCNDEQRLDVHNSLLLSAWDAAFDQGLVSFADDGTPLTGQKLGEAARGALGVDAASPLRGLRDAHRANLAVHRLRHQFCWAVGQAPIGLKQEADQSSALGASRSPPYAV
jgi:putative restriction endonuclease